MRYHLVRSMYPGRRCADDALNGLMVRAICSVTACFGGPCAATRRRAGAMSRLRLRRRTYPTTTASIRPSLHDASYPIQSRSRSGDIRSSNSAPVPSVTSHGRVPSTLFATGPLWRGAELPTKHQVSVESSWQSRCSGP